MYVCMYVCMYGSLVQNVVTVPLCAVPWRELPEYDVIKRRTVLEGQLFAVELSYM